MVRSSRLASRIINPQFLIPSRSFLDLHKMVNKEAIKKERARLADEMSRGYFADMAEIRIHGGKIAMANEILIPSGEAIKFPDLTVKLSDDSSLHLPIVSTQSATNNNAKSTPAASLLCLSFRASSQTMVESWTVPFLDTFNSSEVQAYEVSFLDSWFFSFGPIKRMFLNMTKKPTATQRKIGYSFGDHYDFRKQLQIVNLLTGYIYLLDDSGRIRWQGFGSATEEEIQSLLSCASQLLDEK